MKIDRSIVSERIKWEETGDDLFPWRAKYGPFRLEIGRGEWPLEPLYTVYVDDEPAFNLGGIPKAWTVPGYD